MIRFLIAFAGLMLVAGVVYWAGAVTAYPHREPRVTTWRHSVIFGHRPS